MTKITSDEYSLLELIVNLASTLACNSRAATETQAPILKSLERKGFGHIEHWDRIEDWFEPDIDKIREYVETHIGAYELERKCFKFNEFNMLEQISRRGQCWDYCSQPSVRNTMERLRHYGYATPYRKTKRKGVDIYTADGTPEGVKFAREMVATATRTCEECGRKYPYYSGSHSYNLCSYECVKKHFQSGDARSHFAIGNERKAN